MSSPIAIARAPVADNTTSKSASPTGLYIPIHKRGGSVASASSPSSSRAPSPQRDSWRSHGGNSGRKSPFAEKSPSSHPNNSKPTHARRSSKKDNKPLAQPHNIPNHSKIPHIYSINDLLILSQSPQSQSTQSLSAEQLEGLEDVIPIIYDNVNNQLANKKSASRRRRTGRRDRKNSIRAPVITVVNAEEVEKHRKRHGNWGFTPVAIPVEEMWRHESHHVAEIEVSH